MSKEIQVKCIGETVVSVRIRASDRDEWDRYLTREEWRALDAEQLTYPRQCWNERWKANPPRSVEVGTWAGDTQGLDGEKVTGHGMMYAIIID